MVTVLNSDSFVTTSLDGYINSVNAIDPSDCFNRPASYYFGSELLMVQGADTLWYPVHMCGSTNTGINWNGCAGGVTNSAPEAAGTPLAPEDCNWVLTGESVIAQACVQDKCAGYILDTTFDPIVTIAKIDGQWNIIGVISGNAVVQAGVSTTLGQSPCPGACCGAGVSFLEATIDPGCGALGGLSFEMETESGGGSWSGEVSANGETFTFSLTCSVDIENSDDWVATGGCSTPQLADSLEVDCVSTGTGSGGMSGTATFNTSGCAACGSLTVTFVAIDKTPIDNCFTTFNRTGEVVIAEACGLPDLSPEDHVIMAKVPKLAATGTGTGTGDEPDQWHIIRACSGIDCDPCGDPPPPDGLACCGYTTATVPSTLTGTISIAGSGTSIHCDCDEQTITFDIDVTKDPPEWNQVGTLSCDIPTGTAYGLLLPISGLKIQCSGAGTGTGTGTGSNAEEAVFFLHSPTACSFDTPFNAPIANDEGFCVPIYSLWESVDITDCCDAQTAIPISDPVYLTLEVSG